MRVQSCVCCFAYKINCSCFFTFSLTSSSCLVKFPIDWSSLPLALTTRSGFSPWHQIYRYFTTFWYLHAWNGLENLVLLFNNRDFTKLRRQRQLQKAIGLVSKLTTLLGHHAFLYISLPSMHDYDVKWPNLKFFWGRERQGDKFYHLFLNSGLPPSLQLG